MFMKLLFVCTHNACRSILSEVITRNIAGSYIEVASAGSNPTGQIHPLTLKYLKSRGYNTAGLSSKSMDDLRSFNPDIVITVCDKAANEACPVWLGNAIKVHWGLPDPSQSICTDEASESNFNSIIDTIEYRIKQLLVQPYKTANSDQLATIFRQIGEEG